MNNIIIRNGVLNDYIAISKISRFELGYNNDVNLIKEQLQIILNSNDDIIFIAELNNQVVGFIHGSKYISLLGPKMINIMALAVDGNCQNMGIGRLLLNALEKWTILNKYSGIRLVSGIDRENAHCFYESMGYDLRKLQKNYIKYL